MKIELAIGVVIDLGGLFGQGEVNGESLGGLGDGDGGGDYSSGDGPDFDLDFDDFASLAKFKLKYAFATVVLFFLSTISAFAKNVSEASTKASAWYHHLAFYVGPLVSFGPIYFTGGACLGGFGCLAIGGGIKIGNWGFGVLFPVWIWW